MSDPHGPQWRSWRAALASPRMHHAWILAGRRGLGKHEFALAAARELVATGRETPVSENDPDVQVLSYLPKDDKEAKKAEKGEAFETKRNIAIDQVRAMQARLTTRPTLGAYRAIIINPADDLERNAANALLKSLEEPPAGTFFLLVTHRPGMLLPAIRSRARILRFAPLPTNQVEGALHAAAPDADPADISLAARASGGATGAGLAFLAQQLGPAEALMRRIASEGDPDFTLRGKLGEEIGARRAWACAVGFVGTLMVVQPTFADVGWPALLPLAVAVIFAFFMLVTRQIARETAHHVGVDTGVRRRHLRWERRDLRLQPVQPVDKRFDLACVRQALDEHHLQQRRQQQGIGVWDDPHPLELGRGLGLARIDHDHPATPLDDVVHAVLDARRSEETSMG